MVIILKQLPAIKMYIFFNYLFDAFRGDLGTSLMSQQPVSDIIIQKFEKSNNLKKEVA